MWIQKHGKKIHIQKYGPIWPTGPFENDWIIFLHMWDHSSEQPHMYEEKNVGNMGLMNKGRKNQRGGQRWKEGIHPKHTVIDNQMTYFDQNLCLWGV